jgi:hypothetical protein
MPEGGAAVLDLLPIRRRAVARDFETSSIESGLFATAFGAGFYEGYVSQKTDLVPVPGPSLEAPVPDLRSSALLGVSGTRKIVRRTLVAGAVVSAAIAGVAAGFMLYARHEYQSTDIERTATEARNRFETDAEISSIFGGIAGALGLAGAAMYALPSPKSSETAVTGGGQVARGLAIIGHF